ncbi:MULTISPECIES: hypothetical protein [Streptomyces]|uniref:Uncharacterized protein n=1 Tax=Streptomyces prasinus TaxID=67345 RepID=A0ABX6ARF5_9ACTN|nr:hypothetical protein [Streptomyces prasinus]QEV04411.1 hypothetical protein CP972_00050 [Streptomyces prasinus]
MSGDCFAVAGPPRDPLQPTDPDIAPEPGWLQTFVDAIEEEKVFAVGGCTTVQYPGGQTVAPTKALREYHGAAEWPKNS